VLVLLWLAQLGSGSVDLLTKSSATQIQGMRLASPATTLSGSSTRCFYRDADGNLITLSPRHSAAVLPFQ
jgi:hypothetical protein